MLEFYCLCLQFLDQEFVNKTFAEKQFLFDDSL